jgi:hypothetical protein
LLESTPPTVWIKRGARMQTEVDHRRQSDAHPPAAAEPRTSPAAETINLPIVNLLSSEVENL